MIGGNQNNNDVEAISANHNNALTQLTPYANYRYQGAKSIFIPGCPVHPDWLILTIVHILTNGSLPLKDGYLRPRYLQLSPIGGVPNTGPKTYLFQNKTGPASGPSNPLDPLALGTIHEQCPRKAKHDAGQFAASVGDDTNCLESVGCRGKETYGDCPTRGWNSTGTNKTGKWCNAPGINHLCVGCTQPMFPAVPFNRQIDNITP